MSEEEFAKIKFDKIPQKCSHPQVIKLYYLGAHTDYACMCCGMTAANKEAFNKKNN